MKDIFFKSDENFEKIIADTLKGKKIVKANQITTGWTNIVYEVETDEGNYFFRFPRDEFWSRTIVKDCEFAGYIYSKTDFNTSKLELKYYNGKPFSVHKKIKGTPLAKKMDSLSDKDVENVGNEIAKFMYELHNLDFNKDEVFNTRNIGLKLPDFLDELLNLHLSEDDIKFWKESKIDDSCNNLVHGDLNPSNVLLDDNNNVAAIIDFGFGGFGDKYDDISRIIGRCPEKFKNGIVKSYESYSKAPVNMEILNDKIDKWNNIDKGYINYMRSIGIYE